MENLIKRLEEAKEIITNDLNSGELKTAEAHLKGMIAGLEVAIKIVKSEMEGV